MNKKTLLWVGATILTGGLIYMFKCPHRKNLSRVFARKGPLKTTHYVVCFDCGRELAYDWDKMGHVVDRRIDPHYVESANADRTDGDSGRRGLGLSGSPENQLQIQTP